MVSRTPKPMVTRRRSALDVKKGRPKRNVSPKNLDDSVTGLSWKEERELKKALYASLQESRRPSRDERPEDGDGEVTRDSIDLEAPQSPVSRSNQFPFRGPKFLDESSCSQDSNKSFIVNNKETEKEIKKTKFHAQRKFAVNSFATLRSESLRCEARGSDSSLLSDQKKIHAQRKFAQGSVPSTPSETPSKPKLKVSPVKLFPVRPKTEDFLTYLCFRGTSFLPPHLDLMNVRKEDFEPVTNGRSGFTRDSSPASSSSTSHNNEDSNDVPDIAPRSQTPSKKAARASASTPETARGFANLRRSRNGKNSPLARAKLSSLSASHRKRLADSYHSASKMKKKNPHKGSVSDRLALKRKAMATLTAARRSSPQKQGQVQRKMKPSMSDGELLKGKMSSDSKLSETQYHVENNTCVTASDSTSVDFDYEAQEHNANEIKTISNTSSEFKHTDSSHFYVFTNCKGDNSLDQDSLLHDKASADQDSLLHYKASADQDSLLHDKASADKDSLLHDKVYAAQDLLLHDKASADQDSVLHDEESADQDALLDDLSYDTMQTGSCLYKTENGHAAEDSGIQTSFHDNQALDDQDGTNTYKSLDYKKSNMLKNIVGRSSVLDLHDSIEVQRCERHIDDSSELIMSLFNPLSSDLDESIDIPVEIDMDISLNQSLDINEVFLSKDSPSFSFHTPCKIDERFNGNEEWAKSEWETETRSLFKPAFDCSPKATGSCPTSHVRKNNGAKVDSILQRRQHRDNNLLKNVKLYDHNYSKVKKDIKFKVKSKIKILKQSAYKQLCSSPVRVGSTRRWFLRSSDTSAQLEQNKKLNSSCSGRDVNPKLNISTSKSEQSRKRKSMSDIHDKSSPQSPSKRRNLRTSKRVEINVKTKPKSMRSKSKSRLAESLETHPNKRLGTVMKVKKTFKPHRPMTRATSHLKSVLKAAKNAASKKLRFVKSLGKSSSSVKTQNKMSKLVEQKRKSNGSEKKKLSSDSSGSNSSLGSDASGEIRIKTEQFPDEGAPAAVVQCPTYYPSEEQFRDPILYIQSIEGEAEQYGMCKIVPPCSWKMESRELEDFRFTTQIQFIHKMQHKWSPITEQLEYIKKLNEENGREEFQVPQIGGVELDLVKLYELVQKYGGMKGTVGKEKKWVKIADVMKIPKQADRVSKLYAAYCKYLLAYETHTDEETDKLVAAVQAEKQKQEKDKTQPLCYKCIYKGKSQPLSAFNRAARNTQLLFGQEDSNNPDDVESDYWDIVRKSDDHISVQGASLDTSIYGSMFPVRRDNTYARHGWNLHNFVESKGSILHHLGLIAGVTVPTLHIGMLYTTKCMSCNGHNLPTVQYLHQGPGLIWYAVPKQETGHLKSAMKHTIPTHVRNTGFCLQPESIMVSPTTLKKKGVSMSRCVQSEREFVVVFSSVNYCNISTGYNLSESVHYGTQEWIPYGCKAAKDLSLNYDVELFSMDAMLVFLARDPTTSESILSLLLPYLEKVVDREISERKKLLDAGLKESERLHDKLAKPPQKTEVLEEIIICDVSNKICYLSMVLNSHENSAFSLDQGLLHIQKKKNLKHCKLMFRYSEEELKSLVKDVKVRIKGSNSSSPASTSPKRKGSRKSDTKSSPSAK